MNLSYQYLLWEKWREQGGIPSKRPKGIPKLVPPTWWLVYKSRHPKPKPLPEKPIDLAVFASDGGFAILPNDGFGPTEVLPDMKKNGFQWIAFQAFQGDGVNVVWGDWMRIALNNGIIFMPWARCRNLQDVAHLVEIAKAWGSLYLIVNLENEAWEAQNKLRPRDVVNYLKSYWTGRTGLSTVGFPPIVDTEGKPVGWSYFNEINAVGMMQTFRNENLALLPDVCYKRGHEVGFNAVTLTLGTYPVNEVFPNPALYKDWAGKPRSLYTIDSMLDFKPWAR